MDLKRRADLIRAYRFELKQARTRPALPAHASDSQRRQHRADLADWENSRHGMRVGERLRARVEGEPARYEAQRGLLRARTFRTRLAPSAPPARVNFRDMARANVRVRGRTAMSGANGFPRILTPHERINAIGVASRRRRVSPGLVPDPLKRGRLQRRFGSHAPPSER